jgi:hypothetical protein
MSSDTSLLEDLAQQVATNAKSVSKFIEACGYAQPSFDRDAPISVLPESAPENIQIAQQNLTDAALKLYQLSLGPREYLPNLQASVSPMRRKLDFSKDKDSCQDTQSNTLPVSLQCMPSLALPLQDLLLRSYLWLHFVRYSCVPSAGPGISIEEHYPHGNDQQPLL